MQTSRLALFASVTVLAGGTLASITSAAVSQITAKVAEPCRVISAAKVKTIFKLPTLPSHSYNAQANVCTWFPDPNSQESITLGIIVPQPDEIYAPGPKTPGVTIDKEPSYGKTAYMIIESAQTFFDYQQANKNWVQIEAPGTSASVMLAFAKAIHTVVH
jgi:hypothetical protein